MAKKSGFGLPSIFDLGHEQDQGRVELPPPPEGYRYVPLNPAARRAHPELVLPEDSYAVTPQGTVQGTVPKGAIPIPGVAGGGGRYQYKFPAHTPEGIRERAMERDRLLQQQHELRGLGTKEGGQRATKGGYTGIPTPAPGEHPTLSYQLPIVKGLYAANDPAGGLYADALIKHMMTQGYDLSKTIGMDQPFMKTKAGIAYQTKHGYPAYEGTPIDQTEAEKRSETTREKKLWDTFQKNYDEYTKDFERPASLAQVPPRFNVPPGTAISVSEAEIPPWVPRDYESQPGYGLFATGRSGYMTPPEGGRFASPDVPVQRQETPWYMSEALRSYLEGPQAPLPSTRMMEQPNAVQGMSPAMLRDLLTRLDPVAGGLPSSTRQTSAAAINQDLARYGSIPRAVQAPVPPPTPAPSMSQTVPSAAGGGVAEALQNLWKSFTARPDPENYAPPGEVEQRYNPDPETDLQTAPEHLKDNEEE